MDGEEIADILYKEFRPPSPFSLLPGSPAPPFSGLAVLPQGGLRSVGLDDRSFRDSYLVLLFYPGDWTHLCPTELTTFSQREPEFKRLRCHLLFCSTDTHFTHKAFLTYVNEHCLDPLGYPVRYPMLSDSSQAIAKAYGVLKADEGLAYRATFIIDPRKRIRQIVINDLQVARDVEDTLNAVAAFRHADKGKTQCPANWSPPIRPDGPE